MKQSIVQHDKFDWCKLKWIEMTRKSYMKSISNEEERIEYDERDIRNEEHR
jgi:hypothetical protein